MTGIKNRADGLESAGKRIRLFAVKNLVGPQHHNHFVSAHVGDVMRPAGHGFYHLGLVATGQQFMRLAGLHVPELKAGLAPDHQKLLGLAVVLMPATGDARVGCKKRKLPAVWRYEHFGKYATRVSILRHGVGKQLRRQVADIG